MSPSKKDLTAINRLSEPTFRNQQYFTKFDHHHPGPGLPLVSTSAKRTASSDSQASSSHSRPEYGNSSSSGAIGGTGVNNRHGSSGTCTSTSANGNVPAMPLKRIKCVFVGDACVGKTSLIVSYTTNGYPKEYVPTAFDNFSVLVRVDNQPVQLQICDTAGQNGFDNLRPLCYPSTDVFVLCFSVVNPDSFYNLHNKWVPEVQKHAPDASLLLVGTQSDLRTNVSTLLDLNQIGESVILESEAKEYCKDISAIQYIECSALTQQNLKEVFDAAILTALKVSLTSGQKSKIEKARNQNSNANFSNEFAGHGRKSFKKLKDKIKRSNSVDSAKHSNVQVRRQTSNSRINQIGVNENNKDEKSSLISNHNLHINNNISNNNQKLLISNNNNNVSNNLNNNSNINNFNKILNLSVNDDQKIRNCQKFSTTSAPATEFYGTSTILALSKNSPNDERHLENYGKLKKGWKKLLCMA